MEFPEVKIAAESSEKTKFWNNANERANVGGRKLKGRRQTSRRQEAKRKMGKPERQRNEVNTMVDYCTDISAAAVISECSSILKRR